MTKILDLLKNRRVWAGLVVVVVFILQSLSKQFEIDVPVLTDLLTNFGVALSAFISASLALWSFIKPKK